MDHGMLLTIQAISVYPTVPFVPGLTVVESQWLNCVVWRNKQ